jgi:hypothetical protein
LPKNLHDLPFLFVRKPAGALKMPFRAAALATSHVPDGYEHQGFVAEAEREAPANEECAWGLSVE